MDELTKPNEKTVGPTGRNGVQTSTGPRTPEGKKRARRNAVQHGVFAKSVLKDENFRGSRRDYDEILGGLLCRYPPSDLVMRIHVEQLAFDYVRLRLLYNQDVRLAPRMFEKIERALSGDGPPVVTELVDRQREIVVTQKQLDPELLMRYETSIRKSVDWNLEQLERLQKNTPSAKNAKSNDGE